MSRTALVRARAWSRSCDIALRVYRALADLSAQPYAARVVAHALTIPETVASAYAGAGHAFTDASFARGVEALAVLQTQLYLAAECGLLPSTTLHVLNQDTDLLASELRAELARVPAETGG